MIRALIVDDSAVMRKMLRRVLESDPGIRVVGEALDGAAGVRLVAQLQPDVVTMDIEMPTLDGFAATRRIMETTPVPIVIVSASYKPAEVKKTFLALEAGALSIIEKPEAIGSLRHAQMARELVRTVRLMSEVKVIRRSPGRPDDGVAAPPPAVAVRGPLPDIRVVAVGASTGGPPALRVILSGLHPDFPAPVLVVQHIAAGFTKGFAEWLNQATRLDVCMATHREYALAGRCYVAPDGFHLNVENKGRLLLSSAPPDGGLRPSVASLFRSVAAAYEDAAVGVLLTGMGRDGAAELKSMKDAGAITICQDRESSTVHGMPGEAIRLGAATHVQPLEGIAPLLNRILLGNTENTKTRN